MENVQQKVRYFGKSVKSYGLKAVIGFAIITTGLSSYGYNEGGVATRVKFPSFTESVKGELPAGVQWIKQEGYYLKIPFVSRTYEFNKTGTVAATDNKALIEASSIHVSPMIAPFADAFEMRFEWSARYEIAYDDAGLENMFQKLKSQEALLGNTVMPFAQTLFTNSVNQMIGENFAQGGKSTLLTLLNNQAREGMYQTRVEKVTIARKSGSGTNSVLGGTQTDLEVTKVVYLTNPDGTRKRTTTSISQYGIKIVQNSFQIVENQAKGRLIEFMDIKKKSQSDQIKEESDQKLLVRQAKSAQLRGEKALVERTNILNIEKQEAIIQMEKQVAMAMLQADREKVDVQKVADLAIIDKTREQQIATASRNIQKANSQAATYEAKAIISVGLANARVKKADYAAIDKDILISNNNTKVAIAMYNSDIVVKLPNYVNIGGESANRTSIEQMSTLKMMEQLKMDTATNSAPRLLSK